MGDNDSRLTLGSIPGAPEADRKKLNELMNRVNGFVSTKVSVGNHLTTLYGVSRLGQSFAILVTAGLLYKVRVFVELENLTCKPSTEALGFIYSSIHTIFNDVQEKINEIRSVFNDLYGPRIYKRRGWIDQRCAVYAVPRDWMKDPDQYLKRGDVVLTCCRNDEPHAGVYIGDGMIVHYVGKEKESSSARRDQLKGTFVPGWSLDSQRLDFPDRSLFLVGFGIRTRSGEEIASIAEERADRYWGMGSCNRSTKNSKHFASDCATGEGFNMMEPEVSWMKIMATLAGVAFSLLGITQ